MNPKSVLLWALISCFTFGSVSVAPVGGGVSADSGASQEEREEQAEQCSFFERAFTQCSDAFGTCTSGARKHWRKIAAGAGAVAVIYGAYRGGKAFKSELERRVTVTVAQDTNGNIVRSIGFDLTGLCKWYV